MFKLESYITPVILSYVEKYVKNFKPEQSQVSLWGGDASFQNLDLRLEVLEEQLNVPFSFVSGHIHELLIHVPWVKITSEPIVVTINTIECILKLKDESKAEGNIPTTPKKKETTQEEAPSGYIKSIVTKVVNNITIHCNNLILKYVEEDIVLSVNVRFLSVQTVDEKWEPAFTDVNTYEVMLRKIITIQDLTLCLDKMDTSGKIEIYQDPVLYRCSMMIRLIINYHSNTAKRASITRLDLHCQKMAFSMTEQQIPMLLRLVALIMALQTKQFLTRKEKSSVSIEDGEDDIEDDVDLVSGPTPESIGWGGWAWNMVSSLLPVDWDNDWSDEQQMAYSGHTIHLGVYIDDATLTFKTVESIKEQLFYKSRKLRYKSFLSLRLNGVIIDALLQGIGMTSFQVGIGCIQLYPRGTCSCGHVEVVDGVQPPLYIKAGKFNQDYLKDSLFDKDAVENKGKKRDYKQGIDYHLALVPEHKLLERCPAFVMDYVHCIELPEDITPDKLTEFTSNFEYSNFHEHRLIRYLVGDLTIRLCSGIFHRIDTVKEAAAHYDYSPYIVPKPEPVVAELPPVTLEEYEALRENVSMVETKLYLIRASLQLQLSDHCITGLPRQRKIVESRTIPLTPAFSDDPLVSIECDEAVATILQPLYPFRLAACASKQIDLSSDMFNQCHKDIKVQVHGAKSQLYLTKDCHTSLIMPCTAICSVKKLLYSQYWNTELVRDSYSFQIDSITITGTKAKLMVAASIVTSLFSPTDTTNPLICSSLFSDACSEQRPVYLELSLENISCKILLSLVTISNELNIHSIKVFALNDSQQAFILSGPEIDLHCDSGSKPLLMGVLQFPTSATQQVHPPLLSFQVADIRGSLDPLFFQWLEYHVTYYKLGTLHIALPEQQQTIIEGTSSDRGSRKKTFPSIHESVHSLSDKEKKKSMTATEMSKTLRNDDTQKKSVSKSGSEAQKSDILVRLAEHYPWWSGLVLSGYIGHIVIYIPSTTLSAIGAHGIDQARERAIKEDYNLQILVIKMPTIIIHSSNIQIESLAPYITELPVKLPKSMWSYQVQSFPWTLSLLNLHCYTVQRDIQKNCIKRMSLNATIAITTKTNTSQSASSLTSLGICVHIDNTPIIISVSEEQVVFMNNITTNILNILKVISNRERKNLIVPQTSNEIHTVMPVIPQTPSTPTQILYPEDATTNSTVSTSKEESSQEKEGIVLTAWVQWTITKVAVKLYITGQENDQSYKLVLELEDIITTLDFQPVYLKLKNKITTFTIFNYTRGPHSQNWDVDEHVGLVLCGKEDSLEKGDDSGFLNFTLTRARSGNVHTRWGAFKRHKIQKRETVTDFILSTNGYITEIVVKIQMMDIILPLSVVTKYMQLVKPITCLSQHKEKVTVNPQASEPPYFTDITTMDNEFLPLIYLECKGFRLMVPASMSNRRSLRHDLLMLQLDGIRIAPHAENPICRTPLRSDIYQLAAQANILSVPGSAVEDRQYQINIRGVCAYTSTWKDYQISINKRLSQSYLYTMNENPALEWNKLGNGSTLEPHFSTLPILTRFDLSLIIAPAVVFKPDTIVCGSAVEVNCVTDIDISVNLDQIKLISTLNNECKDLLSNISEEIMITEVSSNQKTSANMQHCKQIICTKQIFDESEVDITKDSGIDFEMSSINSVVMAKPYITEHAILPPFEFQVNCGKITLVLYENHKVCPAAEFIIDINETDDDDDDDMKQPLFYVMVNQPNIYLSQQNMLQKIQISCFDVMAVLGEQQNELLTSVPTAKDFKIYLIETKSGDPHPDTGIPPSFLTVKCDRSPRKNPHFSIDMGRPTKIHLSLSRLKQLQNIKDKIMSYLDVNGTAPEVMGNSVTHNTLPSKNMTLPDINLTTKQVVFSLKTDMGSEIMISYASLNETTSTLIRPDRIFSNISIDSVIISAILNGNIKVLLNPWCCNITVCLLWESWQDIESMPQIQVQADTDSIYLDFGPEQIRIINTVLHDCHLLLNELVSTSVGRGDTGKQIVLSSEQHYKDDLKVGAFQFIDGNADELPLPYQVLFFAYPQQAMAWRYPQPRTLTKVHVSPVPFETLDTDENYIERIPCAIEYWSDSHMAYQRYVNFYLSETDTYRLDLPDKAPTRAVACVWRVILFSPNNLPLTKTIVSSRALAACLRIDSYFNTSIIPNVQAALNIGVIYISLYNHIITSTWNTLPAPLNNFSLKGAIPEMQCFMSIEHKSAILVFNRWIDGSVLIDVSGTLRVHILDYSHLTMQEVLDPLEGKFQLSLSNKTDISVTCSPFALKLGPAEVHTLTVSAHLWSSSLEEKDRTAIILTRYVVANDSNTLIRFGQSGTDDNILLDSRQCYFYSWRRVTSKMLRISIEEIGWTWSRPFSISKDGTQIVDFGHSWPEMTIFVSVSSLSATQKLVTFFGQLVISNQIIDNFEMKLVKYEEEVGSKITVSKEVHAIPGRSRPPSIVLKQYRKMAMRLRFTNLANLSWTGDIPLQPNAKCSQPWLVKVPLQERGQFLSIWVRIITQTMHKRLRILAVLSPLYMIRSHLPVPVRVQIETPSLKTSTSTIVHGRGEHQQLYYPGTFEHFHQLTFQLESGVSASNPYVPLSYSSVDQRKFFRRPEHEDIEAVLTELERQKEDTHWPFQGDDAEVWVPAEQPQTHVQVKYQDAGLASSTLLLELQPWCFILNSLGCQLSLVSEDVELCHIAHHEIVTPPKLESTFYLGVGIGETYYTSQALQLARPDWSQSFYMPRIEGLIPVEGNIKTSVDCGSSVCIMSITSDMHDDMRLVRVMSSHVIGNLTSHELCIATIAVHEEATNLQLPHDLTPYSINILPSEDQRQGVPIVQWHTLYSDSNIEPIALYISLSLGHQWSCPFRVDQNMSRRCIAIPNGLTTMPVVVTTQEDKGTIYILIHIDDHPQLLIENTCAFKILLGQANETSNCILPDSSHFSWICEVESNAKCHYSLPCMGSRLPDSTAPSALNILLLSTQSHSHNHQSADKKDLRWSRGINLSALTSMQIDQFIRLPHYGDVKLIMQNRCYTTYISISPISQVEVSARDIRSRLLRKESKLEEMDITSNVSISENVESSKLSNAYGSSTSTSVTSFFSAQDESSTTDDQFSPQLNVKRLIANLEEPTTSDCNETKVDNESIDGRSKEGSMTVYLHGITMIITHDVNENAQRIEVASLSMTNLVVTARASVSCLNLCVCIGDLQLDNQMFEQGGFDFPVVLISQSPLSLKEATFYTNSCLINSIAQIKDESLIAVEYAWERDGQKTASKDFHLKVAPISAYIEDTYITQLLDYATLMVPPRLVMPSENVKIVQSVPESTTVYIPEYIMIDARILSAPLRLRDFNIEPVSILLSVHTSVHLYVALDHSPLYFGTFERKNLLTTPYRLGNALTMHYLSGAIFGAGWVVGSLEILGSPGGLAQALGSGLRDFVSLPFKGLLQGPWGFIVGITHGSASLMKHVTAGTVNSVTKLASSVARNLDRLTLDEEHLQRQEESRRMRPQGMAQGLYQGLTGLGMSVLGAVAGLAHHPLQQVWSGEATTKSLVTGVGLGLVGVVTKPLSGAAELVALTGQGLLQGAGWNSLPLPRQRPIVQYTTASNNAAVRYAWRLLPLLENSFDSILHVTSADYVIQQGNNRAVTLVLTRQALILVNMTEDSVERVFSLKELSSIDHPSESTILCLYCLPAKSQSIRPSSPTENEMDQDMRARVAEYVRTSSTGLASVSTNSDGQSETFETPAISSEHTLTFYVCPGSRNYLLSLFNIAKRQRQGSGFFVL